MSHINTWFKHYDYTEYISYADIPAGQLIAKTGAGDNHAEKYVREIEALIGDCPTAHYDGTTYVFSPGTTDGQIDALVNIWWPGRVVRYTDESGIEFDYED